MIPHKICIACYAVLAYHEWEVAGHPSNLAMKKEEHPYE